MFISNSYFDLEHRGIFIGLLTTPDTANIERSGLGGFKDGFRFVCGRHDVYTVAIDGEASFLPCHKHRHFAIDGVLFICRGEVHSCTYLSLGDLRNAFEN